LRILGVFPHLGVNGFQMMCGCSYGRGTRVVASNVGLESDLSLTILFLLSRVGVILLAISNCYAKYVIGRKANASEGPQS
jgi:hypothetical protein